MGISARKGNGGYIGTDARTNVTSSTGVMSMRKHRLERLDGNFAPIGSVLFEDDFNNGAFGAGWSTVVSSTNSNHRWMVGQNTKGTSNSIKPIPSGSSYAAYVTDDFGDEDDNRYVNDQQCYMYFDFTVPSGTATLTFQWMCQGENSTTSGPEYDYDYGYILITDTAFTPVSDTSTPLSKKAYGLHGIQGSSYFVRITGSQVYTSSQLNLGKYNLNRGPSTDVQNEFINETITLGPTDGPTVSTGSGSTLWVPGSQRRLIFSWKSDNSVLRQPSWTIANLKFEADE